MAGSLTCAGQNEFVAAIVSTDSFRFGIESSVTIMVLPIWIEPSMTWIKFAGSSILVLIDFK